MNLENTKDLKDFFSNENLNFFKNLNQELSKIEKLLEKNQHKKYLLINWKKYKNSKRFKIDFIIS